MSELQVKTMAEFMAEGKEADILFWVGSAGSFDDRAKKITRAFVRIMNKPRGGNYHWVDNHIVRATRFDGKFTDLVEKEVSIQVFES